MTRRATEVSFAQQRLWFIEQLFPRTAAFHLVAGARLRGALDLVRLRHAFAAVAERHEPLRASFPAVGGRPVQMIDDAVRVPIGVRPFAGHDDVALEARRPFDLAAGPLWRVVLFTSSDGDRLVVVMHHLISDGWSMNLLIDELGAAYAGTALPPLPIRYSDYVRWERSRSREAAIERGLAYWRATLAGAPAVELPADFDRPPVGTLAGARCVRTISAALRRDTERLAADARTTPFVLLLAAFFAFLARVAGQRDISVGCPVANREREGVERLIGLLIGTVVLRVPVDGGAPFAELVRRVRQSFLSASAHADVPLEQIVDALHVERAAGAAPLFRTLFVFQSASITPLRLGDLDIAPYAVETASAALDLALYVMPFGDAWEVTWEYSTDLFHPETIRRFAEQYETMLAHAVREPATACDELALAGADERESWSGTAAAEVSATLADLWREIARSKGDACALRAGGTSFTYAELDERSAGLAGLLIRRGLRRGALVGVLLERSPDLVVALLAVLRAGGAYVVLDPQHPEPLLRAVAADAAFEILISDSAHDGILEDVPLVRLRADDGVEAGGDVADAVALSADDVAYVIYTSGSTGAPKGVVAPHRGAVNRLRWMWRRFPFGENERALYHVSTNFVDSVWDLFGPLLGGIPLLLAPSNLSRDASALAGALLAERITRVELVPSLLDAVIEVLERQGRQLPDLRVCISSGEPLPPRLAARFRGIAPRARLLNLYGSSEVAADVTCHDATNAPATRMAVGHPIDSARLYILDERQRPVPLGAWGELWAAGAGLAHGYHRRPALTAERFVADPFAADAGQRMFRTGDRARRRFDGAIELGGRLDFDVKIRGQRVDPLQVESVLLGRDDVAEAACALVDGALTAYVVLRSAQPAAADLRRFLAARLPSFMIPGIEIVAALPRTPTGKVDRAALPAPSRQPAGAVVAPRGATEQAVAAIWCEKLRRPAVGVDENFFEIGGHSLLLVQVQHRLAVVLGRAVSVAELFEFPTIRALAAHFDAEDGDGVAQGVLDRAAARRDRVAGLRAARGGGGAGP